MTHSQFYNLSTHWVDHCISTRACCIIFKSLSADSQSCPVETAPSASFNNLSLSWHPQSWTPSLNEAKAVRGEAWVHTPSSRRYDEHRKWLHGQDSGKLTSLISVFKQMSWFSEITELGCHDRSEPRETESTIVKWAEASRISYK